MKPGYKATSTQSFAEWDRSPSVDRLLKDGRLDRIYSFGVRETCYKVELSTMWYPEQSPCWGLAVRHNEWATHLAELERLQTGHQASWGDIIALFLPDDGGSSIPLDAEDEDLGISTLKLDRDADAPPQGPSREGIRMLTNILLQLSEIVSSVKAAGRSV